MTTHLLWRCINQNNYSPLVLVERTITFCIMQNTIDQYSKELNPEIEHLKQFKKFKNK